ncbi:hypothetical protein ACET3Z_025187 [Daucus carota]
MDRSLLFLIHVILWNLRKTKDLVNALHQVGELVLSIAAKEFAVPMILMNHEETDEAMVMRCLIALVLIVLKSLFKCQEAFVDVLREAEGAVIKFCMESERPRVAVIMSAPARWCELDLNLLEEIRGRLRSPTDQARFRGVCKAWHDVRPVKMMKSIPWQVKLDREIPKAADKLEFRVYDPSSMSAFVHNIFWADLGIPSPSSYKNIGASHKIVVITYCKSDTKWTAREFERVQEFVPCDCIPIYFREIFYLVSPFGQVASYNIVDDEFKFESLLIDESFVLNYNSFRIYQVFELNGELMLIYFGSKKKDNDSRPGKQCIRMYDWSNKVWIPVSTLGDNAIFVGDQILSVAIVNTEETKNCGVLPNKIYRFYDFGCIIYSLEDGNLVEYTPMYSNLLGDGCGDLPEFKYNCGITFWDATKAFYWLEPPTVMYKQSR